MLFKTNCSIWSVSVLTAPNVPHFGTKRYGGGGARNRSVWPGPKQLNYFCSTHVNTLKVLQYTTYNYTKISEMAYWIISSVTECIFINCNYLKFKLSFVGRNKAFANFPIHFLQLHNNQVLVHKLNYSFRRNSMPFDVQTFWLCISMILNQHALVSGMIISVLLCHQTRWSKYAPFFTRPLASFFIFVFPWTQKISTMYAFPIQFLLRFFFTSSIHNVHNTTGR